MFIVTVVEYGESCDGHAHIIGTFDTKNEAEDFIKEDMIDIMNMGGEVYEEPDFIRHELWCEGESKTHGCVWDILDTDDIDY